MQRHIENPPEKFVDLLTELSVFDIDNRKIIDSLILNGAINRSLDLNSFLKNWEMLNFNLADDTELVSWVDHDQSEKMHTNSEPRFMCRLKLIYSGEVALNLQVWVKNTPIYSQKFGTSPIALYHTKVSVNRVEGFKPFKYYDAIMYLLREIIPPETNLLLFVRQRDSREQLDRGANPKEVPLTKVFVRAGWRFESYQLHSQTNDQLRRHRLRLISS